MIRFARDFRLIPIVLLATISLFALKVSGLVFDGGYTLAQRLDNRNKPGLQIVAPESVPDTTKIVIDRSAQMPGAATPARPWAQAMFNYNQPASGDVTGSVGDEDKSGTKLEVSNKPPGKAKLLAAGSTYELEPGHIRSPGERAILESLHERRQQLDNRSRELDMRENLLKAAEKRVEEKVAELKDVEARVKSEMGSRDKAEAQHFKDIIAMYENMKPKDAARIFDHLDMKILIEVATQMKPRAMSAILAEMTPATAEKLTVELANRASAVPKGQKPSQLPKIQSQTGS
jgi:flagellar motility protein MotE (MotC chaperone)